MCSQSAVWTTRQGRKILLEPSSKNLRKALLKHSFSKQYLWFTIYDSVWKLVCWSPIWCTVQWEEHDSVQHISRMPPRYVIWQDNEFYRKSCWKIPKEFAYETKEFVASFNVKMSDEGEGVVLIIFLNVVAKIYDKSNLRKGTFWLTAWEYSPS